MDGWIDARIGVDFIYGGEYKVVGMIILYPVVQPSLISFSATQTLGKTDSGYDMAYF